MHSSDRGEPQLDPHPDDRFTLLDRLVSATWSEVLGTSRLVKTIRSGAVSRELYAIYLLETYHYTSHNARNQALVAVRDNGNPVYSKFCFEHAGEECGHERMALHDMVSLGIAPPDMQIPDPLAATETLIAYLYWISSAGNPLRRLGYSYWAESCYDYIDPLLRKVQATLGLAPSQMTFFVAHSEIDAGHAATVRQIMQRTCKSDADWEAVADVAQTSLRLTGRLMEAVYAEYLLFVEGRSRRYGFLRNCVRNAPSARVQGS
jgi:pyrroloquinoline quinone (PQQ) biosynthesis protein C